MVVVKMNYRVFRKSGNCDYNQVGKIGKRYIGLQYYMKGNTNGVLYAKKLVEHNSNIYERCPKGKFPYFIKKQRRDQIERKFIYK